MTTEQNDTPLPTFKVRDAQLCIAALWLSVADIAKTRMSECSYTSHDAAEFWEKMMCRATAKALDHMRAGLHKKTEASVRLQDKAQAKSPNDGGK